MYEYQNQDIIEFDCVGEAVFVVDESNNHSIANSADQQTMRVELYWSAHAVLYNIVQYFAGVKFAQL